MRDKLKNVLFYCGLGKETYRSIFSDITASNRSNLQMYSAVASLGLLVMVVVSFFGASLEKNRHIYFICAALCFLLFALMKKCNEKNVKVIYTGVYAFIALILLFGIALGTFIEPNEMSVSFPILMFAISLLFVDRPIIMNTALAIGIIVYIIAALATQDDLMFRYNMSNVLPYGFVAMVLGSYMITIKARRYALEKENKNLVERDQLTGLLNRRSFENHIQGLRDKGDTSDVVLCALDVNGLKNANDNIGHHAGDELIKGAAQCIRKAYGEYGRCYRSGGDEFMAIIEGDAPSLVELRKLLQDACASYQGTLVKEISIASGIVHGAESMNIDLLVQVADQEMYNDKKDYYLRTGHDRRAAR